MSDYSGLERLAAHHAGGMVEVRVTRPANLDVWRAELTVHETQFGAMVGTGHGTARTVGEAVAVAVSDWMPIRDSEREAVAG